MTKVYLTLGTKGIADALFLKEFSKGQCSTSDTDIIIKTNMYSLFELIHCLFTFGLGPSRSVSNDPIKLDFDNKIGEGLD